MIVKRITLFKLFGFTVKLDLSWFFIIILIVWSLATGFFPSSYRGLQPGTYWLMGIAGAIGIFLSIILHELSHSLVARRYGLIIKGITLFIFGGVAEMKGEPPSPRAEFSMAAAGPVTSIVLGAFFLGLGQIIKGSGSVLPFYGTLRYLGLLNSALGAFNLIPAFPLDGGRVLRSSIWKSTGNLKSATRITSRIGSGFGFFLIGFGVFNLLRGNFIGGMWWFLIGLFLSNAARSSYQQMLLKRALQGEKVKRFMETNPVTVPKSLSIQELVNEFIYKYHYKMFPVVANGNLMGCVSTRKLHEIPRKEWNEHRVEELLVHCSQDNTVTPETSAIEVLGMMKQSGMSRLMVVDKGKLVGIITLKDMLEFISLKIELEEEE
jgi:Zn-dependent protease